MKDTIGWVSLQSHFPELCEFSSGLATIYPGTTRVESDFSILGWERDGYRSALMDFLLEGIMHANQFMGFVVHRVVPCFFLRLPWRMI
jgi:hypothetical protein